VGFPTLQNRLEVRYAHRTLKAVFTPKRSERKRVPRNAIPRMVKRQAGQYPGSRKSPP